MHVQGLLCASPPTHCPEPEAGRWNLSITTSAQETQPTCSRRVMATCSSRPWLLRSFTRS